MPANSQLPVPNLGITFSSVILSAAYLTPQTGLRLRGEYAAQRYAAAAHTAWAAGFDHPVSPPSEPWSFSRAN